MGLQPAEDGRAVALRVLLLLPCTELSEKISSVDSNMWENFTSQPYNINIDVPGMCFRVRVRISKCHPLS